MDGDKQLLSEESSQASECKGIEAPSLVREDITADEKDVELDTEAVSSAENVGDSGRKDQECEETGQNEVKIELEEIKQEETPHNDNDKATEENNAEDSGDKIPDQSSPIEDGAGQNEPTSSELNPAPSDKDCRDKPKSEQTHEATKDDNSDVDKKRRNGNNFVEVILDDGNNNAAEKTEVSSEKERRTRFSSEITIQPKAYFQAGAETVIMMPPSTSDEVFRKESSQLEEEEPTACSTHVALSAKSSNAHLPPTFLPLTISSIFCCPMVGLFAVYKSYSVKQFIKKGDMRKASEASQHARQLGVLTLFIGFFFVLAIITIAVLVSTLT